MSNLDISPAEQVVAASPISSVRFRILFCILLLPAFLLLLILILKTAGGITFDDYDSGQATKAGGAWDPLVLPALSVANVDVPSNQRGRVQYSCMKALGAYVPTRRKARRDVGAKYYK